MGMDGDGEEVYRAGTVGHGMILAGTVGNGDKCSSPCSPLNFIHFLSVHKLVHCVNNLGITRQFSKFSSRLQLRETGAVCAWLYFQLSKLCFMNVNCQI